MKTTIDIPEAMLTEAIRHARAKNKRDAVVAAVRDFNRRHRMASLTRHLGTCKNLMTAKELSKMRETD
jgi:Arc/MetJ family transcription regulator